MGHVKEKYTREYFLGSIDKETGEAYGVAGFEGFKLGLISNRYLKFLRRIDLRNKIILDIGCGRGEVVDYCLKNGCKRAVGIDFSSDGLDIARALNKNNPKAEFIEMEARDIGFTNEFDIVFLFDVIEHIPDEEMQLVYCKARAALKNDGMLILNTPIFKSPEDTDNTNYIPSIKGMHCNKQTEEKLCSDLKRHKFRKYTLYVWGKSERISIPISLYVFRQKLDILRPKLFYGISHPWEAFCKISKKLLR